LEDCDHYSGEAIGIEVRGKLISLLALNDYPSQEMPRFVYSSPHRV
jgi:hypothetical protein